MFVCNDASIELVARSCNHPPGSHQPIAGVKLPDGSFLSRLTAEYPLQLAEALAEVIQPFVTHGGRHVKFSDWRTLLPPKLEWPLTQARVEDGGGVTSTALQCHLPDKDPLAQLRARWLDRLCASKDCLKISHALRQGLGSDPITAEELNPYLRDLLQSLDELPGSDRADLMEVVPGQPFRLSLWERIATVCNDPDVKFFGLLKLGVPLGVNSHLDPAPCWPIQDGQVDENVPLQACESSWKSARDHPAMVQDLIADKVKQGFIALIPGGVKELQSRYDKIAIGKLGLVLAEGRSPRLVVDSSVSMVTTNTAIPNRMLLPKVSDLCHAAPLQPAKQSVLLLALDASKAHRRILIHPDDRGLLCFHAGDDLYQSVIFQ